ncbi:MAG TPA: GTPase HflX [Lachnospiraceae bacterium]|nr:GTPase HflX [Lachnospiraceae bacterium]
MTEVLKLDQIEKERVLLIGVNTGQEDFEHSMEEFKSLAEACNMEVVGMITQNMEAINKALYIGTGKVCEVKEYAKDVEADLVICEETLSPSQLRNLQDELGLPVMDRTNLILDIFSTRAKSREAKLQVEVARLKYLLPRLVGLHDALSRQGGASGSMSSKGAGEKKLELDKRRIEHRIAELSRELEELSGERATQRKRRMNSRIPQVALAGYTNAGKSTLMNAMVDTYVGDEEKKVLEKDMLFATLETSVRRIDNGKKKPFYLADTVGFIHKLPAGLVKAFRSTLEEIKYANLILEVVDFSDPNYKKHIEVTEDTLRELGAGEIPIVYVYNKSDLVGKQIPQVLENKIFMSAKTKEGIEQLVQMIISTLYTENQETTFLIPYDKGQIVSYLCENAEVLEQNYIDSGVSLVVHCHKDDIKKYEQYIVKKK